VSSDKCIQEIKAAKGTDSQIERPASPAKKLRNPEHDVQSTQLAKIKRNIEKANGAMTTRRLYTVHALPYEAPGLTDGVTRDGRISPVHGGWPRYGEDIDRGGDWRFHGCRIWGPARGLDYDWSKNFRNNNFRSVDCGQSPWQLYVITWRNLGEV
jgi:hypothetical protein